jgi:C-terminal peptidase prc
MDRYRMHFSAALALVLCVSTAAADDSQLSSTTAVDRAMALIDLVSEHHVDPPTQNEMVLAGGKALYRAAKSPQPFGLSQRVSRLASPEQLRAFLGEVCEETATTITRSNSVEGILLRGIAGVVPGETFIESPEQFKVQEQLAGNRYVGIGIVLNVDEDSGYPRINNTFARGSAHQAGAKDGDLITQIEGLDTHKMNLAKAVELLRGEEGTSVTIMVRQPKESEPRKLTIPRTVVPRQTVRGYKERGKEQWSYQVRDGAPIAYVQIAEFSSSTVHELRQVERELRSNGCRALILDLRRWESGRLREVALVADALLDGGIIGRVRTSKGVRKYEADADCLFRGWPMAVLVGEETAGETEWLAAALQDGKRARLVGRTTAGQGFTSGRVPTADGGAVTLVTGILERADGSPLPAPTSFRRSVRAAPEERDSDRRNGVKPDHPVSRPRPEGRKATEGSEVAKAEPPRDRPKEMDPALAKAMELLEAELADRSANKQSARTSE